MFRNRLTSWSANIFLVGFLLVWVSSVDAATTITVDSTADESDGNFGNRTCNYTYGAATYWPAPDGKCTLRRATLEAGVRPDTDRPITIEFNIPTTDANYDSSLGIWEIQMDESEPWTIENYGANFDGKITIDGNTQPGGRTDGPKIMINTNKGNNQFGGVSLQIYTPEVTLRNLGFHGGGQIILYDQKNTVDSVWMGLRNDGTEMKLASTATSQAEKAMARGGIILPSANSDNNTIKNCRIIGAFERAIRVTSQGRGNIVEDNFIGMNAAGEVPLSGGNSIDCTRDVEFLPSLWYGGEGIDIYGSGSTIRNNTIAGLHKTQSTNELPATALSVAGLNNTVEGNVIGIDATGAKVGVCGQGIVLDGRNSTVTGNKIYFSRNGLGNPVDSELDTAIFTQDIYDVNEPDPWFKVWNNVIDGGDFVESNFHTYRFGTSLPDGLRKFIPAKITSIDVRTVTGTNGDPVSLGPDSICPDCTVFLYADDMDDRIEAFELLGTATADAFGDWQTTISRPLRMNESLRTQSMSNAANIIDTYGANTTTRLSDDYYVGPYVSIISPILGILLDD